MTVMTVDHKVSLDYSSQARIQRGGGAGGARPPFFAPNSFKRPLNWQYIYLGVIKLMNIYFVNTGLHPLSLSHRYQRYIIAFSVLE